MSLKDTLVTFSFPRTDCLKSNFSSGIDSRGSVCIMCYSLERSH